jgi:hypothetical protein
MDNSFEILLILFGLISLFNLISSKKKKDRKRQAQANKQKPGKGNKYGVYGQTVESAEEVEGYKSTEDIIKESREEEPVTSYTEGSESWNPEEEFKNLSAGESILDYPAKEMPKIGFDTEDLSKIKKGFKRKRIPEKEPEVYAEHSKFVSEMIKKLKEPKMVREYFIVHEILNKPKALRR